MGKIVQWFSLARRQLLEGPADLHGAFKRYFVFSNYGALIASGLHLAFAFLFFQIQIEALGWYNTGSSLFFLFCLYLNHLRLLWASLVLVSCEVLVHAYLSVWYLGWESGFHYYVLAMAMVIFFTPWKRHWTKTAAVCAIFVLYLLIRTESERHGAPLATVEPAFLNGIQAANILGFMVLLATFAYYYNNAATVAEDALEKEHARSERLLHNILPAAIANRLKNKEEVIADGFDEATVLFADLVGFTYMAERMTPQRLVELLGEIFSRFDRLCERHGLEKIKTIGDAYMVASGVPQLRSDHAQAIARMALEMRAELNGINKEFDTDLNLRIGIHSGAVVAGVIGMKKFSYDLWGDTVNTAARMESHGVAGEIQVSEQTWRRLRHEFEFVKRGVVEIKGKGKMTTYLLLDGKYAEA